MMVRRLWIRLLAASAALIVGCANIPRLFSGGGSEPVPKSVSPSSANLDASQNPTSRASATPSPRTSITPTPGLLQPTASPAASPTESARPTPSPAPIPDLWPSKDGLLVRVYRDGIKRLVYRMNGEYAMGSGYSAMTSINGVVYFVRGSIDFREYQTANDKLFDGCTYAEYDDMIKPFRIDHANGPLSFTPTLMWNQGKYVDNCSLGSGPPNNGLNFSFNFPLWLNVTRTGGYVDRAAMWYYDPRTDTQRIKAAIDVFPFGGGASFSISTAPLSLQRTCEGCGDDSQRIAPARHGMYFLSKDGVLYYVSAASGRFVEIYRLPLADVTDPTGDSDSYGEPASLGEVIDVALDLVSSDPKDALLWIRISGWNDKYRLGIDRYSSGRDLLFLKVGQMAVDTE